MTLNNLYDINVYWGADDIEEENAFAYFDEDYNEDLRAEREFED